MLGKNTKINHIVKILIIVTMSISAYVYARASWTPPPAQPPYDNVAAPINTGPQSQTKTGSLTVGSVEVNGSTTVTGDLVADFSSINSLIVMNGTHLAKDGGTVYIGYASSNPSDLIVRGDIKIESTGTGDASSGVVQIASLGGPGGDRKPVCAEPSGKLVVCNSGITVELGLEELIIDPLGFQIRNQNQSIAGTHIIWNASPANVILNCNATQGTDDWLNYYQNQNPSGQTTSRIADAVLVDNTPGTQYTYEMECISNSGDVATGSEILTIADTYITVSGSQNPYFSCYWDIEAEVKNVDKPPFTSAYDLIWWRYVKNGQTLGSQYGTYIYTTSVFQENYGFYVDILLTMKRYNPELGQIVTMNITKPGVYIPPETGNTGGGGPSQC